MEKSCHFPPSSQSSLASSFLSAIQNEGTASVTSFSPPSSPATSASMAAHGSSIFGFAPPADTKGVQEVPLSLSAFERRTNALEEERLHYAQLGQRAADAFEEHRRELTQLVQKERAIRSHREDALRAQLQETLQANRELMARVAEQRQRHEKAWFAELQGHRGNNTRQGELESTLWQLHEEWLELRRGVAEVEASHEEHRRSLAICLRDQECLRNRVRSLQDGLWGAEAKAAVVEQHGEEVVEDRRGQMGSVAAQVKSVDESLVEKPPLRTYAAGPLQLTRQPRCSQCDVPPKVWGGSSPTRCAPRRHFVPTGPWDASSPCRASSPCTHNVEAMVATIERDNYLRPRLYYHRVRCGPTGMAGVPVAAASAYRQHRSDVSASRPPPPPPGACTSPFYCASATTPRHGYHRHLQSGQHSPGLSSSSTSSGTSTSYPYTTTEPSSSYCSCQSCEHVHASSTASGGTHSPSVQHRDEHQRAASPRRSRRHCFSLRARGERATADTQASAGVRMPFHPSESITAPGTFQALSHVPLPPPPPAADGLHGVALNATCRALITDLADMRAEYRHCQRQLRDPNGDSVAASQEMRRLMHEIDGKADQIRALRLEQGRHNDALRVRDVLREVMTENRYCEAVYSDLMDLIRT
ncbi:hypothetical protein Q4I30_005451 [Leishmania utingensis]|uniref:Uncharacterized protein n=1 Tax=Leishmania utingensis TaxID=653362 RepID=A0AAW3AAT4_9TRYP